ncbi:neprilysin-4-like [Drosophila takahashii]|uniref:neprilysin-4-like n=1 Tax=Drosophila takahashii TaxID=29030 RepID=UPI001CF9117E|nr:neprilysin-4-like [Drosophila takahashii]
MKWIIFLFLAQIAASSPISKENSVNERLLENLMGNVNQNSSACDDFFEHACGNFKQRHINDHFFSTDQMMKEKYDKDLHRMIIRLYRRIRSPDFKPTVDAKALRYILNCHMADLYTFRLDHYLKLSPPAEGLSWPVFTPPETEWPEKPFKWMETLALLHRYGITNSLVKVEITQNSELKLSMPSFEEDLSNVRIHNAKRSIFLSEMKQFESEMEDLIKVEKGNDEENYLSVQEIESKTGIEWHRFIESLVGQPISLEYRLFIKNLNYFTALKSLLDFTDDDLLANYLMIRFAHYLKDNTEQGDDLDKCIRSLGRQMHLYTNLLYKENFQDSETLQQNIHEVYRIFEEMRQQLVLQINQNRLQLSDSQKEVVLEKVQAIKLHVGAAPRDLDYRRFVTGYYEDLHFPSEDLDYGKIQLDILESRTRKGLDQKLNPASGYDVYTAHSKLTNAYYVHAMNLIVIPYVYLQEPFFTADSHDVFKYSQLGFTLGHELMHAIGTLGIYRDLHGEYLKEGHEILSLPQFKEGLSCINRERTEFLEERLADIEGTKLAYATYSSRNTKNVTNFTDLNPDKIFFLNTAHFFCQNGKSIYKITSHGDHPDRVNQIVKNYDPFNRAFGCSLADQQEKCQLW